MKNIFQHNLYCLCKLHSKLDMNKLSLSCSIASKFKYQRYIRVSFLQTIICEPILDKICKNINIFNPKGPKLVLIL